MFRLLGLHRYHECGDARDHPFALYALVIDVCPLSHCISTSQIRMNVDYASDCRTVYTNFALACLNSTAKYDLLFANIPRLGMSAETEWPSWVPDWRTPAQDRKGEMYEGAPNQVGIHDQLQFVADEGRGKVRLRVTVGIYTVGSGHVVPAFTSIDDLRFWSHSRIPSLPDYIIAQALDRLSLVWNSLDPREGFPASFKQHPFFVGSLRHSDTWSATRETECYILGFMTTAMQAGDRILIVPKTRGGFNVPSIQRDPSCTMCSCP
jgi:hypothetical protein